LLDIYGGDGSICPGMRGRYVADVGGGIRGKAEATGGPTPEKLDCITGGDDGDNDLGGGRQLGSPSSEDESLRDPLMA